MLRSLVIQHFRQLPLAVLQLAVLPLAVLPLVVIQQVVIQQVPKPIFSLLLKLVALVVLALLELHWPLHLVLKFAEVIVAVQVLFRQV